MYLAKPCTPATEPANRPGSTLTSTSATTAMRIVLAVTPISVAWGAPPPVDWAPALLTPNPAIATHTVAAIATHRRLFIRVPPVSSVPGGESMARLAVVVTAGSGRVGPDPLDG